MTSRVSVPNGSPSRPPRAARLGEARALETRSSSVAVYTRSESCATRGVPSVATSVWVIWATPAAGSKVRCSSSRRPSPSSCQSCSWKFGHERVAVHRLDHQAPVRAQDAPELGHRPGVLLVSEVAERAEQVHHEVEAPVGHRQLPGRGRGPTWASAVRRPGGGRPRAAPASGPRRWTRKPRQGLRDRVAAESARRVEHVAALRACPPDARQSSASSSARASRSSSA